MAEPEKQIDGYKLKQIKEFLFDDNNSTAIIILMENACIQYQDLYKKNNVPYSFIKFYFKEFEKYSPLFSYNLKQFYNNYLKMHITVEDLIDRYNRSHYSQHEGTIRGKQDSYLVFPNHVINTFSNDMQQVTNTAISAFAQNILTICKKINNKDELVNNKELYDNFLIQEYILNNNFDYIKPINEPRNIAKAKAVKNEEPEDNDKTLIGEALEDNYQSSGKITRIIIPKLNLPSAYPSDIDSSRVNKDRKRATKLSSPAKQIIFINKNRIVNVKYSSGFINKRTKKQNKFKFDF